MLSRMTVSLLVLTTPLAALAEEEANVFELGQIEVSTPRLPLAQDPETVIGRAALIRHDRPTVAEAAELDSGVTLERVGARNELNIRVRGFDLRQVPIFVDGIPVYVPYDGYADLGRFTTSDLAEVQVAKGFSSVLYGPNTLGGAVNLVSQRPTVPLEGEIGLRWVTGKADGTAGQDAHLNVGTRQGNWYAQLGSSYRNRDAYSLADEFEPRPAEDGGARENAHRTDRKLSFKVGLTPGGGDEYAIGVVEQRGEKGNPPYAGDDPNARIRYWRWPWWDKRSVYFLSRTNLDAGGYIKSRLYYDTFENALYGYKDDSFTETRFKSYYDDYTYGGVVEFGQPLTDNDTIRLAAHWKTDFHRESSPGEPQPENEDRTLSLAVEETHRFSANTRLVAGVSHDRRRALKAEETDGTSISNLPTASTSAWNPQAGLFHTIDGVGEVRLTVARKTRFPTIKDRYSYRFGRTIPNPELEPERANHYEIGHSANLLGNRLHLETSLFYSDVDDLMQFVRVGDVDGDGEEEEQMKNIGEVRHRGAEITLDGQPTPTLNAGIGYGYLERTNVSDPDVKLTDTPEHELFAHGGWYFLPDWEVMTDLRYESGRISSSDGRFRTHPFTVVDLKIARTIDLLELEAGVHNAFDRNYALDEGFPERGREWFVQTRYTF